MPSLFDMNQRVSLCSCTFEKGEWRVETLEYQGKDHQSDVIVKTDFPTEAVSDIGFLQYHLF